MNTTQDEFRLDLADALDASAHDLAPLDTDALVAAGTRRVRQRRLATVAGVGALAVVVGLGASWLPSLTGTPSPAAPTPVATAHSAATARVELPLNGGTVESNPNITFEVSILPGQEPDLVYSSVAEDGTVTRMGGSSTDGLVGQSTLGTSGDDIVLGIVPSDAVAATLMDPTFSIGGFTSAGPVDLPGTPWAAVGFRLDSSAGSIAGVETLWWRADGTPVTNAGSGSSARIAQGEVVLEGRDGAKLTVPAGNLDVWLLPQSRQVGIRGPAGTSSTPLSGDRVQVLSATNDLLDETRTPSVALSRITSAYLVSGTAADVTPAWADGLEAEEVTVVPWPAADRTVVFITANAEGTRAGQPISDALTGLSWTDADGVRQEWKP